MRTHTYEHQIKYNKILKRGYVRGMRNAAHRHTDGRQIIAGSCIKIAERRREGSWTVCSRRVVFEICKKYIYVFTIRVRSSLGFWMFYRVLRSIQCIVFWGNLVLVLDKNLINKLFKSNILFVIIVQIIFFGMKYSKDYMYSYTTCD